MNKRRLASLLFLVSGIVLMAAPAMPVQPDWVDRMIAGHSAELVAAAAVVAVDRLPAGDWVDRRIATGAAPQPNDWIDRMIADRGGDYAYPSLRTEGVRTALMRADTKAPAGSR